MHKNIKSYFDNHPAVDVFYFTSDGYAFFKENDAKNHAKILGDCEVSVIERNETEEENTDQQS